MEYLVNTEFDSRKMSALTNDKGQVVDKYIPRKCSATSRIIGPKDHASIQIFVPDLNEDGTVNRNSGVKVAICGFIRDKGRSDFEIEKILRKKGVYPCTQ